MMITTIKRYWSRPERIRRRIAAIEDDIPKLRSELRRLRKQQLKHAIEVEKNGGGAG